MYNRLFFIFLITLLGLTYSCKSKIDKTQDKTENNEKSEIKKFLKVIIKSSKIRSTPDLEGAVLERSKEDILLEYLEDSTNFTSSVVIGGKNIESRWYKVKSKRGNEGWIAAVCVQFLTNEENRQIISLTEDEELAKEKESKTKSQKEAKIDSNLLNIFNNRLGTFNPNDSRAFPLAVSYFESVFQQKSSATADLAFAELMKFHDKVFKIQESRTNAALFQHYADEIKIYGDANLDLGNKGSDLMSNYIGLGLNKKGRVYIKKNYDRLMRKFLRLVGPSMQHYLEQCALESDSPPLEEGQITVPLTEIAAHAVFWDKYLSRFPNSPFKSFAKEKRKFFSAILFDGFGNKKAFSDAGLNQQFKESYLVMTSQMGVSPLIKSFKEYYILLESEKFKETEKVKAFVEKVQCEL